MTELDKALARLLKAGAVASLRIEAVIEPKPQPQPDRRIVFNVGPVSNKG